MSLKDENLEIQKNNQNELRDLEQFYTNGIVDSMILTIEKKKEEITAEIIEYANKNKVGKLYDKNGKAVEYGIIIKPIVILNYFFKPIINLSCQVPVYNAEKLGLVFDYYCHIIAEVNDKIGNFPSSLSSFCKLAGITSNILRNYRNCEDINMRIVVDKIYDQIGDSNITMSQIGSVNTRTTIFKMKSQNEMIEKQQPTVHVNIIETPDKEIIDSRINKYKNFAIKKSK